MSVFDYLDSLSEVLVVVERVCREWRACSRAGGGWWHLDTTKVSVPTHLLRPVLGRRAYNLRSFHWKGKSHGLCNRMRNPRARLLLPTIVHLRISLHSTLLQRPIKVPLSGLDNLRSLHVDSICHDDAEFFLTDTAFCRLVSLHLGRTGVYGCELAVENTSQEQASWDVLDRSSPELCMMLPMLPRAGDVSPSGAAAPVHRVHRLTTMNLRSLYLDGSYLECLVRSGPLEGKKSPLLLRAPALHDLTHWGPKSVFHRHLVHWATALRSLSLTQMEGAEHCIASLKSLTELRIICPAGEEEGEPNEGDEDDGFSRRLTLKELETVGTLTNLRELLIDLPWETGIDRDQVSSALRPLHQLRILRWRTHSLCSRETHMTQTWTSETVVERKDGIAKGHALVRFHAPQGMQDYCDHPFSFSSFPAVPALPFQ